MKILSAVAAIIFFAIGAFAETTNDLSDAEIQGRQLAQKILEQRPTENFTNTGVLEIRDAKGSHTNIPVKFETFVDTKHWENTYKAFLNVSTTYGTWVRTEKFSINHSDDLTNSYFHEEGFYGADGVVGNQVRILSTHGNTPFAGSDFWLCDLGLEFFHWPEQKILKHEMKRGRACTVLESTNPNPSSNGYSRVVSWIDDETLGIVHAEAYDFKNKLLKEFDPKSFKKVNGQWELQEMEIRNVQTGSRTRLEFDVKKE